MDILQFLTQTLEGKAISIVGLSVLTLFGMFLIINRYFTSRHDDTQLTKTMLANQSSLVSTIASFSDVNRTVAASISEDTKVTAGLAGLVERLGGSIDKGNELTSSIREQLSLDRTLIEAKLTDIPNQVKTAMTDLFNARISEADKSLLHDLRTIIRSEGVKIRTGAMVLAANGDIVNATTDFLELTGTDKSIIGKNVIKDDILRVIAEDGTPLVSDTSPFYSALSSRTMISDTLIGVLINSTQNFAWFMLKIAPSFSISEDSRYVVSLTEIGSMVKAPVYNVSFIA